TNFEGGSCLPCKRRREWDKAHPEYFAQLEAEERQRKESLRTNCPRCHGLNTYEDEAGVHPCQPHLEVG
uniref:hypothetical protein n=1 Tax=Mycobacterium sp. DL99 TaxID=2528957 RepID=UPI001AEC1EC7